MAHLVGSASLEARVEDDIWGALLKPASFRGCLCFAPGEGQNVRFTAPQSWLGGYEAVPPDEALPVIIRQ